MKCDELRGAVDSGQAISVAGWEHVESCPRCREEFAHLRALRGAVPEVPPGLRDRVVEAAFPGRARGPAWIVAAAAAVALAFAGGIAVGRDTGKTAAAAPETVKIYVDREKIVATVQEIEKPSKADDGDLFLLALALEQVYKKQVSVEYDGISCKAIHADKAVFDMVPYCPIARKLWVAASERPDVVDIRK
ncbi:MAG: hypothetical protein K8T20_18550 [Planctomycetes bacterium]|nr:hypothetical protein [Planctomycetota bacterium]